MSPRSLVIALGLAILVLAMALPLSTAEFMEEKYAVPGGELLEMGKVLERKDRMVGFFSIRGEPPEIGFRILTPEGKSLAYLFEPPYVNFRAPDVVAARHNFNFAAPGKGQYTLQFDNRNYTQNKEIELRLTVIHALYGIHPTNLLILLGFGVIFLGYVLDDITGRRYREVEPEDFEYAGGTIFFLRRDPRIRVDLRKLPGEVAEELRKSGLKPKSKFGLYYSLRNRAGLK